MEAGHEGLALGNWVLLRPKVSIQLSFYWLLSFQVLTLSPAGHSKYPCLAPITTLEAERISNTSYSKDLVGSTPRQHPNEPQSKVLHSQERSWDPSDPFPPSVPPKLDYLKSSLFFLFRGPLSRLKSHLVYHVGWLFLSFGLLILWTLEVKSHPPMHNKKNQSQRLPSLPRPRWHLLSLIASGAELQSWDECSHAQVRGRDASNKLSSTWYLGLKCSFTSIHQWVTPSWVTMKRPEE